MLKIQGRIQEFWWDGGLYFFFSKAWDWGQPHRPKYTLLYWQKCSSISTFLKWGKNVIKYFSSQIYQFIIELWLEFIYLYISICIFLKYESPLNKTILITRCASCLNRFSPFWNLTFTQIWLWTITLQVEVVYLYWIAMP